MLTITVSADNAEEIADLVLALQNQRSKDDLSKETVKKWVEETINDALENSGKNHSLSQV